MRVTACIDVIILELLAIMTTTSESRTTDRSFCMEFLAIMTTDLQKATRICDRSRLELISPGPVTAVWNFPVIQALLRYDIRSLEKQ